MLFSTVSAIVAQLPILCMQLHLSGEDCDDAHFSDGELPAHVVVSVGEIHLDQNYRLTFNPKGKLLKVERAHWPSDGDITFTPVELPS